ncbi:fimbrillin family protein [Sphingobacterium sp. Mn56C]|uniref:fimbrillin family protein n=1 Tax=Sphingobacterium sp. Mn56C TaxID=3395261 RepID=UPI003BC9536F
MKEQTASFKIDEEYYGHAVLKPVFSSTEKGEQDKKNHIIGNFNKTIKYKVAVFDKLGNLVHEKDGIAGEDAKNDYLMLETGETYSFVVYAVGSAASLPDLTFTSSANKTINTAEVRDVNVEDDFMFFRKDGVNLSESSNSLNIELKHLLSALTVVVDTRRTKEKISGLMSTFNTFTSMATIHVKDGSILPSGNTSKSSVTFPKVDNTLITSKPMFITTKANKVAYTINKIVLGSSTKTNIVPFSKNPEILPGFKYELKLTIFPKDKYVIIFNEQGVMINGRTWMYENLGHAVSGNSDLASLGCYYQWGRLNPVADGIFTGVNGNWLENNRQTNAAWNSGTEERPKKTKNDPCPKGFRIPTAQEYMELFASTIERNKGTCRNADDINDFNSYRVFTSKISSPIELFFPLQGSIGYPDAQVIKKDNNDKKVKARGVVGDYWTSTTSVNNKNETILFTAHMESGKNEIKGLSAWSFNDRMVSPKNIAHAIRCIDDTP